MFNQYYDLRILALVCLFLAVLELFGRAFKRVIKVDTGYSLYYGLIAYFGLFAIFTVPFQLLHLDVTVYLIGQIGLNLVVLGISIREILHFSKFSKQRIKRRSKYTNDLSVIILTIILVIAIGLMYYRSIINNARFEAIYSPYIFNTLGYGNWFAGVIQDDFHYQAVAAQVLNGKQMMGPEGTKDAIYVVNRGAYPHFLNLGLSHSVLIWETFWAIASKGLNIPTVYFSRTYAVLIPIVFSVLSVMETYYLITKQKNNLIGIIVLIVILINPSIYTERFLFAGWFQGIFLYFVVTFTILNGYIIFKTNLKNKLFTKKQKLILASILTINTIIFTPVGFALLVIGFNLIVSEIFIQKVLPKEISKKLKYLIMSISIYLMLVLSYVILQKVLDYPSYDFEQPITNKYLKSSYIQIAISLSIITAIINIKWFIKKAPQNQKLLQILSYFTIYSTVFIYLTTFLSKDNGQIINLKLIDYFLFDWFTLGFVYSRIVVSIVMIIIFYLVFSWIYYYHLLVERAKRCKKAEIKKIKFLKTTIIFSCLIILGAVTPAIKTKYVKYTYLDQTNIYQSNPLNYKYNVTPMLTAIKDSVTSEEGLVCYENARVIVSDVDENSEEHTKRKRSEVADITDMFQIESSIKPQLIFLPCDKFEIITNVQSKLDTPLYTNYPNANPKLQYQNLKYVITDNAQTANIIETKYEETFVKIESDLLANPFIYYYLNAKKEIETIEVQLYLFEKRR